MIPSELLLLAKSLGVKEKVFWKSKIARTFSDGYVVPHKISLENLVGMICSYHSGKKLGLDLKTIGYGAGKMAEKFIPEISKSIEILEIWDAYSDKKEVNNIPVVRLGKLCNETSAIVFIDDYRIRNIAMASIRERGCENIYYFRDYISLLKDFNDYESMREHITPDTFECINELNEQYMVVHGVHPSCLFPILPKRLNAENLEICNTGFKHKAEDLKKRLTDVLVFDGKKDEELVGIITEFLSHNFVNKMVFAQCLEVFLRNMLNGGTKTAMRPIRMRNDLPYDSFAVTEAVKSVAEIISDGKDDIALKIIRFLRSLSESALPLIAAECSLLNKCGRVEESIKLLRKTMQKEPNSLLISEMFYQTAQLCKEHGMIVAEPLPEYDLKDVFCWCGINFAWCGGFDNEMGDADFAPCFRPLQCEAHPKGPFWSSEEWGEFRKSLIDGTFKYCQKDQCPNIVAGWLPNKADIKDEKLKKLLDGDFTYIPKLEELHFSYDGHCNLQCPSCRLEIQTNTKKQNEELDKFYEMYLKPYVKKAQHLCLSGCGEAMISPHSKKILQSFNNDEYNELIVELRTNVTTVNPNSWEKLGEGRKFIRHIAASIDAAEKGTFEKLRYPAKWDIVLRNLEFIRTLRNTGQIDVFEFHVVVQKENIEELLDIVKMAISLDVDVITFSRLINWRDMPESEYYDINPFWTDSKMNSRLKEVFDEIEALRDDIESDNCALTKGRKKIFINIHFRPDPNERYSEIRYGRLKIR